MKVIGDMLRADPTLLFTDLFDMVEKVLHQDCVHTGVRFNFLFILYIEVQSTEIRIRFQQLHIFLTN